MNKYICIVDRRGNPLEEVCTIVYTPALPSSAKPFPSSRTLSCTGYEYFTQKGKRLFFYSITDLDLEYLNSQCCRAPESWSARILQSLIKHGYIHQEALQTVCSL